MTYDFPDHELTLSQAIEACTNGVETPAPSRTSGSLRALSTENSSRQLPLRPEKLRFLRLDEWDEHNTYDEEVPTCLHYSIEWKVLLTKTMPNPATTNDIRHNIQNFRNMARTKPISTTELTADIKPPQLKNQHSAEVFIFQLRD